MSTPVPEDPFAPLDEEETTAAQFVVSSASSGVGDAGIAVALGGAFLVYRSFLRRRLRERLDKLESGDPDELARQANQVFRTFVPAWQAMLGPVLLRGYLNGVSETGLIMDSRFLTDLADQYAYSLGQHINDVSAEALVKGYAAQVNRKVPAKIAVANVVDAFGVTNRTAKSLNNILAAKEDAKLSETLLPSVKKLRSQQVIAASIKQRADTFGQQEAWNARQTGKQVVWMYAVRQGLIPETATRSWLTAEDEMVCPYCGPMHEVEQVISEPFEMSDGQKVWSPPVHPNCRCEVKLQANYGRLAVQTGIAGGFQRTWMETDPEVAVAKADDDWNPKEHPRSQSNGRFVRVPGPGAPSAYQVREAMLGRRAETIVGEMPNELQEMVDRAQRTQLQSLVDHASDGPSLKSGGPSLKSGGPSLKSRSSSGGPSLRSRSGGPSLKQGGSLSRGGLNRSMRRRGPKREIDRGEIDRAVRQAQARHDGRIMARGDDITLDDNDVTADDLDGMVATDVPMYAIVDHKAVRPVQGDDGDPKGIHFAFDGGEVVAGLENIEDKLREMEAYRDSEMIEEIFDYADFHSMMEVSGLRPENGEFDIPPYAIAAAVYWLRDAKATGGYGEDQYVELPVMGYVDGEGLVVDEDDPRWTDDGWLDPESDVLVDEPDYEEIGSDRVSLRELADAFNLEDHIEAYKPVIVRLNKVRDNDIAYDAKGLPYANPVDRYKVSETLNLTVRGETYQGYHVEPQARKRSK